MILVFCVMLQVYIISLKLSYVLHSIQSPWNDSCLTKIAWYFALTLLEDLTFQDWYIISWKFLIIFKNSTLSPQTRTFYLLLLNWYQWLSIHVNTSNILVNTHGKNHFLESNYMIFTWEHWVPCRVSKSVFRPNKIYIHLVVAEWDTRGS